MSKAYDRVEWGFVGQMMRKLGFSGCWVDRVMRCVNPVSYSFVVNREICGFLRPTRGLRLEDPLSPYLFLICDEGLSSLISSSHDANIITGFKSGRLGPTITHLFFTDDSMLFSKADIANCMAIRDVLDRYGKASGQSMNFGKSALCVSSSMDNTETMRLSVILGIQVVDCHDRYLGLPCFIELIRASFIEEEADAILSLPLTATSALDSIVWHFDITGEYTVRSGYRVGCNVLDSPTTSGLNGVVSWWKRLWRIDTLLKVKLFVWRACNNWIPTMVCLKDLSMEDMAVLLVVMWHNWFRRNRIVHGMPNIDMCDVVVWSEAFVSDYRKANEVARQTGSQIPKNVVWQPPCIGIYKLNTYATIDTDGKIVGFGAVIRDSKGMVIATSSQRIEATYPPHVVVAIIMYRGLLLATDIGVFSVEAESDAATIVKWVVDGDHQNSDVGLILADIRSLMHNFNFCLIGFVPRKANYVAHYLTKMAFCLSDDCF
ncbi:hypothetical protein Ddye_001214 [Dipteronia dyeriana]|uniref:RNase H type-1 domain-containing protein n=1 Tax=Dipteronia dyeriana TaxID=168575 RepID=A0AAD9XNH5_9ROSI|nr:hypothetical protein Ddye_001214 [Dipteronia dyeriana]